MKLAAIDIGSNGARILVVDVVVNKQNVAEFNKINYLRLPLRLGFDVFEIGEISPEKTQKFVTAMQTFKNVLTYYDVKSCKTCATSAMRDAKNGEDVIKIVQRETGIKIDIISGDEETMLIHETHIAENMDRDHGYLYVNVGGGSTELISFVDSKLQYKKSFNIGTIRILKDLVKENDWDIMKTELKANVKSSLPIIAIGSGGNINKVFAMSKKKDGKPLTLDILKAYYDDFSKLSVKERMDQFKLRDDRADVIVPALQIYINVMRWAGINEIYVPNIGLVDGLVHALYQELINTV